LSAGQPVKVAADPLLEKLDDPKVQQSLVALVEKLPVILEFVTFAEQAAHLLRATFTDEKLLERFAEVVREPIDLVSEKVRSVTGDDSVAKHLPKWIEVFKELGKSPEVVLLGISFFKALVESGVLEAIAKASRSVKPEKIRKFSDIINRSLDEANKDTSTVSVFALLKLLRDPQVQKGLRFFSAFLRNLGQRG
jgi:uncharacterized protein YjgD (DUF1641 family)